MKNIPYDSVMSTVFCSGLENNTVLDIQIIRIIIWEFLKYATLFFKLFEKLKIFFISEESNLKTTEPVVECLYH